MALNMNALNQPIEPSYRTYDWKDVVLYALGVGAGFDELDYCYEKNLKVLPTFAMPAIMDFFWKVGANAHVNIPGVLHGEQQLILHQPLPTSGKLVTTGKITHYYDKGQDKGALIIAKSDTMNESGAHFFTSIITIFSRLDGGFGGEKSPKKTLFVPDRAPDVTIKALPGKDQPLLYRLSGDTFQLHADPEFAALAGFKSPILHGLCTLGYACRALIGVFCPMAPEKVKRIDCRFSKPLYPGVSIETRIWKNGRGSALWKTINAQSEEIVIDQGIFDYTP